MILAQVSACAVLSTGTSGCLVLVTKLRLGNAYGKLQLPVLLPKRVYETADVSRTEINEVIRESREKK